MQRAACTTAYESTLYRVVFRSCTSKVAVLFLFTTFFVQPLASTYAYESVEVETSDIGILNTPVEQDASDEKVEKNEEQDLTEETNVVETTTFASQQNAVSNKDVPEIYEDETGDTELFEIQSSIQEDEEVMTLEQTLDAQNNENKEEEQSENSTKDKPPNSGIPAGTTSTANTAVVIAGGTDFSSTTLPIITKNATSSGASSTMQHSGALEGEASSSTFVVDKEIQATSTVATSSSAQDNPALSDGDVTEQEDSAKEEQQNSLEQAEPLKIGTENPIATSGETIHVSLERSNDRNMYQFSKDECVEVEDGAFYCGEKKDSKKNEENRLYADIDVDGDREIFLERDGQTTQITHNRLDDAAPYYDPKSESIVWHRQIDERYQIMSFDLKTGVEEQITNSRQNSMEPSRSGKYTAWQEWEGNDWDIMLYDTKSISQISTSPEHDVAPIVYDNFVVWNTILENEPHIALYDIESGEREYIKDTEGSAIQNPRMMLVYDSTHENGDTITKGYDMKTKQVIPLATLPAELPNEIPDSDQTGETRALIQNKANSKDDELSIKDALRSPVGTSLSGNNSTSSASTTLDMRAEESGTTTESAHVFATSTAEVPDVVVTPSESLVSQSRSSSTEHIDDVVVTPRSSSTEEVSQTEM